MDKCTNSGSWACYMTATAGVSEPLWQWRGLLRVHRGHSLWWWELLRLQIPPSYRERVQWILQQLLLPLCPVPGGVQHLYLGIHLSEIKYLEIYWKLKSSLYFFLTILIMSMRMLDCGFVSDALRQRYILPTLDNSIQLPFSPLPCLIFEIFSKLRPCQ